MQRTLPHETRVIGALSAIEHALAPFFRDKLPAFPPHVKEAIAKVAPWVFIVFGGLGLLFWLAALGLVAIAGAMALGFGMFLPNAPSILGPLATYFLLPIELLLSIVGGVFMLSRRAIGWYLAFLGELVSAALSLLSFSIFGVLWSAVIIWALFNIREYYEPAPSAAPTGVEPHRSSV